MDSYFSAGEVVEQFNTISIKKAHSPIWRMLLLGFMAGAFIAFGANASSAASFGIADYGLAKFVAGLVFPVGLIFVILGGAELFTGNILIFIGYLNKKISLKEMLTNWCCIWLGNLVGAVLIAFMVSQTVQFDSAHGALGGYVLKVAAGKTSMTFMEVFISGIMCNWIVALTVLISFTTRNVAGKILAMYFPIMLFVVTGFEHVVANMYYLFAGFFVRGNEEYIHQAIEKGATTETLANINLQNMFVGNFLPATLGNIVGGAIFVALIYVLVYNSKFEPKH